MRLGPAAALSPVGAPKSEDIPQETRHAVVAREELPGQTNRKPIHRKPDGHFPFVRLTASLGSVYVKAEAFAAEISFLYRKQEQQRKALRQSFRPSYNLRSKLNLSRFRNAQMRGVPQRQIWPSP